MLQRLGDSANDKPSRVMKCRLETGLVALRNRDFLDEFFQVRASPSTLRDSATLDDSQPLTPEALPLRAFFTFFPFSSTSKFFFVVFSPANFDSPTTQTDAGDNPLSERHATPHSPLPRRRTRLHDLSSEFSRRRGGECSSATPNESFGSRQSCSTIPLPSSHRLVSRSPAS